ncbi:MAG: ABC transporter permease [Phycisphaerae bacterium]
MALLSGAWGVLALAVVLPTLALAWTAVTQAESPDGGFTFASRQLTLLWRSTWMAGVAAAACVLVSLPGAYVVGQLRAFVDHPVVVALLATPLLCPPMVYAFGWERLLPDTCDPQLRCIWVWASWSWPIPAMLIGSGWSRGGGKAYEAALIVSSPAVAFLHVALPLLARYMALSAVILFVLFIGDYGVPHACGLMVYQTELLGWAASSDRVMDTIWLSIPVLVTTCIALLALFIAWRRCSLVDEGGSARHARHATARHIVVLAVICFVTSWMLPVGTLVLKLESPAVLREAFVTYAPDLAWSMALGGISGLAVVAMGVGVVAVRRARAAAVVLLAAFGAIPGAVVGAALVTAYNHNATRALFDHWPIVALGYVSRFGWIGVVVAILVRRACSADVTAQARTDGAGELSVLGRIHIPMCWPTLASAVAIVAALCIAEVPTTSLVRVPGPAPIALVIIEKFHRFEDGMLISLSLWLAAINLAAAALLGFALTTRDRRPE